MSKETFEMGLIPLKGLVVLPGMHATIDIKRPQTLQTVEATLAQKEEHQILLFKQKLDTDELPTMDNICQVGVCARITDSMRLPDRTLRIHVVGLFRARLLELRRETEWIGVAQRSDVEYHIDQMVSTEQEAFREALSDTVERMLLSPVQKVELSRLVKGDKLLSEVIDTLVSKLEMKAEWKQLYLEEDNECKRGIFLLKLLNDKVEIDQIKKELDTKVRTKLEKGQRDFVMREQIRVIQEELGDDGANVADEFLKKTEELIAKEEVKEKLRKEIKHLRALPFGNQEGAVIRTYVETMLELPWDKVEPEELDIKKTAQILDEDHYGLEKVKERILDYLAVKKNGGSMGTLICLAGPPGTGKTSIAKSIARSLKRRYVRVSLGGVHDEAEIRGHRKTYVGAMPGRIAEALKQAKTSNPLILLDEIDKMANDYHGDPASAMLEVLDGEQNVAFRDHYLEVPLDLSRVLFIATANDISKIPAPLYDRMEIINLSGYTENEKTHIAMDYLVKKQQKLHGLMPEDVIFSTDVIKTIIHGYTREAGVRELERRIGEVCRKVVRRRMEGDETGVILDDAMVKEMLGKGRLDQKPPKIDQIGIVHGLAWTMAGGDTLDIEVNVMPGSGKLQLTGKLGDVMKESAMTALSFVRSKAPTYEVAEDYFEKHDIHVHVPEGAVPKDGPSAGITMATAILSAVVDRPVRHDVAMTGEITLRGRVLPIGGLKEKLLAAKNAELTTVLVPMNNTVDVSEISEEITDGLNICFVSDMSEVLDNAMR